MGAVSQFEVERERREEAAFFRLPPKTRAEKPPYTFTGPSVLPTTERAPLPRHNAPTQAEQRRSAAAALKAKKAKDREEAECARIQKRTRQMVVDDLEWRKAIIDVSPLRRKD